MIDEKTAFAKAVDLAIDTTKLIITLSTTIITLSVTVLKLFISKICFCSMLFLSLSWLCFLASIILGFFYILGITGRYALIGQGSTALAFKRLGINETVSRQKFGWMLGTFVLGIVFLLIFGVSITTINLEGKSLQSSIRSRKNRRCKLPNQMIKHLIFCRISSCRLPQAVPSRTIWRRPLMVRQPYSVAVPSTGGAVTSSRS